MPYYRWRGIDLAAHIHKGIHFARSEEELDKLLLERDIALMNCKPVTFWYSQQVKLSHFKAFFEHLSSLLHAGISLPKALRLVSDRVEHKNFGIAVQEITESVEHGIALPEALERFPELFTPVMITTITTGLETGNLPLSLDLLVNYLVSRDQVRKKLRSAIFMPLFTLGFFLIIAALLIIILVPRFASLLQSIHKDLPVATKRLLMVSNFLSSTYGMASLLGIFVVGLIFYRIVTRTKSRYILDNLLLKVPLIKKIVYESNAGAYFQAIGVLVSGGMHLVPALHLAEQTTRNTSIKKQFRTITQDVASGYALSQAFAAHASELAGPDIIAMLAVGEETGVMGPLLGKIGQEYYERLYRQLGIVTGLVQPILMVFLGLLITGLIIAIYTPVLNLSYAV